MTVPESKLKSGYMIPVLGLGTWQLTGEQCEKTVKWALEMGYSHIDTSDDYSNEKRVGQAIKGFDRVRLFITSKVDDSKLHKADLVQGCRESLDRLGTDYLDLYLVHRPNPTVPIEETMDGMKELVDLNMVRSVGVSNFSIIGTREAIEAADIPICVNQIKIHPQHYPAETIELCKKEDVVVTAYSPLDTGGLVSDDLLTEIGSHYGKSASQVSLRWLLGNELVVIPKASSKAHLSENLDIFNWDLSSEDATRISEASIKIERG
jgi:diketogulonate reductase-like aldo/keto reductase